MNENVLLINIHSSRNLGDAALLQVTMEQLEKNFSACQVTLSMDDPESHTGTGKVVQSMFSWVYRLNSEKRQGWKYINLAWLVPATLFPLMSERLTGARRWLFTPPKVRKIVNAYLDADLVVSKPGGFLYSSGRGISLLVAIYSILYAVLAGKPVYILPQSIGPLKRWWEKQLVKRLLEKVRIVMVREPVSMQLLKDIGVRNPNCQLVADMAFAYRAADAEAGREWLVRHGLNPQIGFPMLGMTVINWGAQFGGYSLQDKYEEACRLAIRHFVEKINGRVVIFPQVWGPLPSQDDRIPAHNILDRLPDVSAGVKVVDQPIPAELLKSIYGWMQLFIGTRMHSNIFALSQGVPVIAIGYLHKTRGIAEMVGIEKWVLEINETSGTILKQKLIELWPERQAWRNKILRRANELARQANSAGSIIAKDYFETRKKAQHRG